ncbi:MAG: M23 family metallopeptidase [Spirochaetales bacterium]|nr:M23 family metallopeptidase [Spirochaetales bacterium]
MKRIQLVLILSLTIFICYGFDWPVVNKAVMSTFCQYEGGDFNPGILFAGRGENVYPIADGEVIFSYEEKREFSPVPYGLGSFIALWHEGDIQSVYAYLEKGSINRRNITPGREDVLAKVGDTGATIGGNLNLMIFNIEENELLNPIRNLIPFFTDKKKPVISGIFLRRANDTIRLDDDITITAGEGEILINAYDLREDTRNLWELAPYEFSFILNGQEKTTITFEKLREAENRLVLSHTRETCSDVYESAWMIRLGHFDFYEGTSRITIVVKDASGNSATKDFMITAVKR